MSRSFKNNFLITDTMARARILSLIILALAATISVISADRSTYIIHTDESKVGLLKTKPQEWYKTILASHKNKGEEALAPELLYTYETAMTGFAAKLTTEQYQSLSNVDGILFIAPDELLTLHTTYSTHFLGLQIGRGLWNESSLASDVVIGVLDTGIWPEHVSFDDIGHSNIPSKWKGTCEKGTNFSTASCNRKVIGARAFLKGYEAINGTINEKQEYRSPRDSNGHGTHTASTAAGSIVPGANFFGNAAGTASGMRFTSRVAAYKVCWEAGCASSDILAAIDQAVADGVDIISMSLGGIPRPYYLDSMAIAAFGAAEKGVFMSNSAGNSGPSPSTVGNMAPWMTTVAASYTDRTFPTKVRLSNGETFKGASLYTGEKRTKKLAVVYNQTAGSSILSAFCINETLSPTLVKDKIVLCERGNSSRTEKGFVVKSAGGAGMLLLNRATEGEELIADAHVLPATIIGASAANSIKAYYALNQNLTASITFLGTAYGARAPVGAAFSSRGPSLVDPNVIKPDITAPGVNILAAWPPITSPTELKSDKRRVLFNVISGTSMSCPHLSGIAALVKSVHRDWSPAAIKSAIMTTAYTHDNRGHLISDTYTNKTKFATPYALGSGHVNPEKASDPGLVYDITTEDYLQYLCSIEYTDAQVRIVARKKYTCPSTAKGIRLQPGDLNYPSFAVIIEPGKGKTTFTFKRTLTNVGASQTSYKVYVKKPKDVKVVVTPKVLNFKKQGEKLSYKVTFSGTGSKVSSRGVSAFGFLSWISEKYCVRSPIAVTYQ